MTPGYLLALEGLDGSGTTTHAARLAEHLRSRGRDVRTTAEPSRGPIGLMIREALANAHGISDQALALMFAADRLDHVERELVPALRSGAIVITDRYLLSSLAYQASHLPLGWVATINARAQRPDASILLRVSCETAAARRLERGGQPERFDDLDRQRQIAAAYEQAFKLPNVGPTYVIDAEGAIETVAARLASLVDELVQQPPAST